MLNSSFNGIFGKYMGLGCTRVSEWGLVVWLWRILGGFVVRVGEDVFLTLENIFGILFDFFRFFFDFYF